MTSSDQDSKDGSEQDELGPEHGPATSSAKPDSDKDAASSKPPGDEESVRAVGEKSDNKAGKNKKEKIPTLDEPVIADEKEFDREIVDVPILSDQVEKKTD